MREASGWPAFLAAASAKVSLKMCLSGSRLVDDGADLLHIGVASDFAHRALSQRDNLSVLHEIAARSYGIAKRIQVSVVKDSPAEIAMRQAAEAARRRELTERATASDTIRAAVEILGGEITDVRPRRRTRRRAMSLGDLGSIMKQAQELQERLSQVQDDGRAPHRRGVGGRRNGDASR